MKLSMRRTLTTLTKPKCFSSPPIKPKTPLFLKPPTHSVSSLHLKKWHQWAKSLTLSIGSSFLNTDNGPDTTLLLRELNWLLQDSLQHPNVQTRVIQSETNTQLMLRASLDDLYRLWKERIEERRPFQYIVGCEHWRDLVLSVEERVLIPRPETCLIVDLVEEVVRRNERLGCGVWADLGTGSGAIAIGVCRVLGDKGKVVASDLSPVAVEVAKFNVERYELQDRIEIRQGSWFEQLEDFKGKLVGVVSNPPYIPTEDIVGLQAEVGRHEPRLALDGGRHGMDYLLHLCDKLDVMLAPGGFFVFETNGEKQCKFLVEYMQNNMRGSLDDLKIVSDFAAIQRFVTGFRK